MAYNGPMVSLFLGLTGANLLLLSIVFGLGLVAIDGGKPTGLYAFHITLAIAAGMMTLATHIGTYMYFMATSRWLEAASHKAGLPVEQYVGPALKRKSRSFALMMAAIGITALTMFAGAACDPTVRPWWPGEVHLVMAAMTIVVNALCAMGELKLIREQGSLMDSAIAKVQPTEQTADAVN